jgi:hypothetical protein
LCSPSTLATWTKLTPSSSRNVAYRRPAGRVAGELVVDGADELLVLLHAIGLDLVAHHDLLIVRPP